MLRFLLILLLSLLAQTAAFAQEGSVAFAFTQADSIVVDNTIKETIKLDDIAFETVVHKDNKYYAIVKTESGEIEEVDITSSVRLRSDGHRIGCHGGRVYLQGKNHPLELGQ